MCGNDKGKLRHGLWLLVSVLVVGFVLHFIWEMAQMPAYTDGAGRPFRLSFREAAQHCLIPTLGDISVAGLTYVLGWAIHTKPNWICQLGRRDTLLVSLSLVLLAIVVEVVMVDWLGWWGYSDLMPLLPLVQVGLLPTVQLALVTLLTFVIVGRFVRWRATTMEHPRTTTYIEEKILHERDRCW